MSFWVPPKFAVKACTLTTGGSPIPSRIALTSGHGGGSGSAARYAEAGLSLAFAIGVDSLDLALPEVAD